MVQLKNVTFKVWFYQFDIPIAYKWMTLSFLKKWEKKQQEKKSTVILESLKYFDSETSCIFNCIFGLMKIT